MVRGGSNVAAKAAAAATEPADHLLHRRGSRIFDTGCTAPDEGIDDETIIRHGATATIQALVRGKDARRKSAFVNAKSARKPTPGNPPRKKNHRGSFVNPAAVLPAGEDADRTAPIDAQRPKPVLTANPKAAVSATAFSKRRSLAEAMVKRAQSIDADDTDDAPIQRLVGGAGKDVRTATATVAK